MMCDIYIPVYMRIYTYEYIIIFNPPSYSENFISSSFVHRENSLSVHRRKNFFLIRCSSRNLARLEIKIKLKLKKFANFFAVAKTESDHVMLFLC